MTTSAQNLFYIENTAHAGSCRLWWRANGHGYTTNLDGAGWWTAEEAARVITRPEDKAVPIDEAERLAERHVPRS